MIPGSDYIHITLLLAQQNDLECIAELINLHNANPTPRTPNQRFSMALVRMYIKESTHDPIHGNIGLKTNTPTA